MDYELKKRFTFGVDSTNVGKPVSFLNDDHIVYLAGGTIIVQNLQTNKQLHLENDFEKFRILGFDVNADLLVTIEESRDEDLWTPYLSIRNSSSILSDNDSAMKRFEIELKEEITSQTSLATRQKSVPICIHKETSLVASLISTSEKVPSLLIWSYDLGLVLKVDIFEESIAYKFPLGADDDVSISFHDYDNVICIQGSKSFMLYRLLQETKDQWSSRLINFPIEEDMLIDHGDLMCHSWIAGSETQLVFGTRNGNLLITEGGNIINSINVGFEIQSLLDFQTGVMIGGPDTICRVYEINRNSNGCSDFVCKSAFSIKDTLSIDKVVGLSSMVIAPSLDKICAFVSTINEIFILDLNECIEFNSESFVQVACGTGQIHSISTCTQKSLVLTAGLDGAIRCWDFMKGQQQFCKYFTERPISVSLHTSGLHAIITFADEVRFVHILIDDLKTFWHKRMQRKLVKGSVFSNGCHKVAIAHDVCIEIYDFYSGTLTHEIKGHHKITQLNWRHGDGEIISLDDSGMLRRWDVQHGTILAETSQFKASSQTSFDLVSREMLYVIADGSIHVLSQQAFEIRNIGIELEVKYLDNWSPSQVVVNNDSSSVLILSNSLNDERVFRTSLMICKVPFAGFVEFLQNISIKCIHLHDDIVVCATMDSLHVIQFKDKSKISNTLITQISLGSDDTPIGYGHILVSELFIEERNSIMNELSSVLLELKTDHDYKVNLMKMKNDDEIFNLEEKHREAIFDQKDESEIAVNEEKRIIKRFEDDMNDVIENNNQRVLRTENDHRLKLQAIFDQNKAKMDDWKHQIESLSKQKLEFITTNENKLEQLNKAQMSLFDERQSMTTILHSDISSLELELAELRHQVEEDIDTFIQEQKCQQEERLVAERQTTLKVVGENGILNKRTHALMQNVEDQKEAIKHLLFKEEADKDEIKSLEKSITQLLTLKKQRNKTFASKEKSNLRFQLRKEELGKFSILDDKLNELKQSLENDHTVLKLREKVEEKENLLAIYNSEHMSIQKLLAFRQHEIKEKNESLSKQSVKFAALEGRLASMTKDLSYYIKLLNQPEELLQKLRERKFDDLKLSIHDVNCQLLGSHINESDDDIQKLRKESEKLTILLKHQNKHNTEEVQMLRARNQELLNSIRQITEENSRRQNGLDKVRM